MKLLSPLILILSFSLCTFGQEQETDLIEECVNKSYTHNSCEKVFCHPWQRCVKGTCLCKLPYQCPKNGTSVCTTDKTTFRTYCQQKSYECQRKKGKFMHRGSCNLQETFKVLLEPKNTSSEGIVQVELKDSEKAFICGEGWSIQEANVACKELNFPEGADRIELIDPDEASQPQECLKATCRGIETSLAECAVSRLSQSNVKLAKVLCHTRHKECSRSEFRCVNNKCIPLEKTCDGINDCGDLSDELCCKACKGDSFYCNSGVCIPNKLRCNNERDCLTGEDESHQLCNGRLEENEKEETEQAEDSMDEERRKIKTFLPQLHCGIANRTITRRKRILGGNTAQKDEFPWQVAIRGERERVSCGGVYIGGCWVLTAAHCVRASRTHVYRIFTGMLNSIRTNDGIDTFNLKRVIIHENYDSKTYKNDIALLELKPKDLGRCQPPNSVPVCIPWSRYMFRSGHQCKVSGWGFDEAFTRQYALKWGYVYLMENCSAIYKHRYFEGMECAGTHDGSVDSCKGDSGGPLVCFDSDNVGYLWGIVSWGENCGIKGYPGVYTKVADYFDWIGFHTGMSLITRYNV
uniref:Complement factor I n=1 Tax=Anolis carolinensis TaxID=28377 RepID=G1KJP9_ANOCA|nr:PREDICTED: complement factor I [Anolis carolinensis]|eukprot:XP_003221801.1 PREDICTED: complement factor I [Anolis carolinensis]